MEEAVSCSNFSFVHWKRHYILQIHIFQITLPFSIIVQFTRLLADVWFCRAAFLYININMCFFKKTNKIE
jgi:hypothetical protein